MSETPAQRWPKTAEGTTDWEAVFEAEGAGLIVVIASAQGIDALHDCAIVVIRSLFTRKNDKPEIERFTALLETAIAEGRQRADAEATKAEVVRILRQIKDQRIELARKYLLQKKKSQAIERRRAAGSDRAKKPAGGFGARPALIGSAAAGALAVGAALWLLWPAGETAPPAAGDRAAAAEARKAAPKPERKPEKKAPPVAAPQPDKPADSYPKAVLLKPFYWSYGKNGAKRYVSYQPFVEVPAKDQYSTVCVNAPWVTDAIYLALTRIHPRDRLASSAELGRIGGQSAKRINGRYGAGTVGGVKLVPNSDSRFRHSVKRCELE
ncbi:MAG: hypothetical protein OXR84_08785 [Magnetovibrio sp.]|nr:hypothetical protein [Magnetovibrio sp.]